ncbi:sensor domain-containing diguanylate cyclase [Mesorhizobium sp. WSM4884]|uniref:sensor domain-containing diguanylate cyclase n=1 Tax=Mesorhizobium sp. WSM4884 TaxID=3038542 RepID=UPI0024168D87|nr:sensor domain-containing diguanylate cyclase [Mesorhizobium sp. WSM4884]MDG4883940.1 sensor domain-containing diguanylate cyclase [Mesorhizobium sp. WSM4884]
MHRMLRESPPLAMEDVAEAERLEALNCFDVIDTPREEAFDRITRLIRNIFDVPVAIVSMIDGHRQWYKSYEGLENREVSRDETFCKYTLQDMTPLVVPDARDDIRFAQNPMVTAGPQVRFYAGVPLRTNKGHNIGTVCAIGFEPRAFTPRETAILCDLAALAMDELELRQLASVDPLTGALSRRAFKERAANAIALAQRHEHGLACIAFDLDHFKSINDGHGHATGDKVLAAVAAACRGQLRGTDIFGRLGGEEFALVLPHTDRAQMGGVAEKVREAIERVAVRNGETPVPVTSSFGMAALDARTADIEALLANADAALYEAKAAGRNRCVAWRSPNDAPGSPRRRVLKAGRILFNNRMSSIDCTVRTLGGDGAGLDVTSSIGVPGTFNLQIRSDAFDSCCRIASQTERHIEVEFC